MRNFTKTALLLFIVMSSNVNAGETKAVTITAIGEGRTLEVANINSYDKARYRAMAFEPVVVYSWLHVENHNAKNKVIQVPAQIVSVELLETKVDVIAPVVHKQNIHFEGSNAVDENLDKWGVPDHSSYRVKNSYRFSLKAANEIDRAKHLGEMQALRDIVNRKSIESESTFEGEGYGSISPGLLSLQNELLKRHRASMDIDTITSFEEIDNDVVYFKKNMLAALARTYPNPQLSKLSDKIISKKDYVLLDIKLGDGCKLGGVNNPVGSLCDLWTQLPEQFKDTVRNKGLANGNNTFISPTYSWNRAKQFIEKPLFYADSPIEDQPFPAVLFATKESLSPSFYYQYPRSTTNEESYGGLQQVALPTSRTKYVAPIGHEMILFNLGIIKTAPDTRLVAGVTDAYSNSVLPDFFATSIVSKSPVTLTIFNLKKHSYIDVPLTSNNFLLTSKLEIALPKESQFEYSIDDFEMVVWWGAHPASSTWKKELGSLSFPTLTMYSDSKAQLDILNFYRENQLNLREIAPYSFTKMLPTSPGAFASLYYSCVKNKEAMCKFNSPSLNKSVVIHGVGKASTDKNSEILAGGSMGSNDKGCWMFDPGSLSMVNCLEMSEKSLKQWWLEVGMHPLVMRKYSNSSELWGDLELRTKNLPVLKSEKSREVIGGKATMPSTIPTTVW